MPPIGPAPLLGVLAIALQSTLPAGAQTIPPSAYGALRWRLIGPHRGGRGLAGARVPRDPPAVFLGARGGGGGGPPEAGGAWGPFVRDPASPPLAALARAPPPPHL